MLNNSHKRGVLKETLFLDLSLHSRKQPIEYIKGFRHTDIVYILQ